MSEHEKNEESEELQVENQQDSEIKAVLQKYTIVAVIVLAVVIMLLSSRGLVEEFDPEMVYPAIEETAILFVNQHVLSGEVKVDHLELVAVEYAEVDWGEYSYEAQIEFSSSGSTESIFTSWYYRIRDDNIDLARYSFDGLEWFEP
ncbi:hypothetical protein V511_13495 [Mesotoga sp. Brook.08.YT.4.2.5.1]|uniref:hypothetical protein n=1 Tax=unclassified Mesotoga TaxID=1184398 RepID=UPI000B2469A6|nr:MULTISPECIES: hypothetical protein [unclassified Mesotoga]PXF35020.1 hypothetical protein EU77_04380 [Mesotoga sp. SC_NapDC]RAM58743.1 hypothetical protein DS65_00570 [Mesotoga sp. SC_4PWL113PWK15]RAM60491.1 hypothetical protein DS67_02020 [Mesotoga sp. SC_4PWA21]RIZ61324.1 hypothetical protein KU43_03560 [Mesotoga sp. SC_NapDC2]PNE18092.1 hypothetical protein V511_13495 [Mesotoga sp. Brook.08.YT.4.2.5.1]